MNELDSRFTEFEQKIGIKFNDIDILKQAFTHRSYLNENKDYKLPHNERLEFLGDAVLELVVTRYLFDEFPKRPEGELTAIRASLVNTQSISKAADRMGANDYLLLSKGESKDMGRARQYILANTFESIIGAIYLDQGYDVARDFIEDKLLFTLKEIMEGDLWQDSKSLFQENAQDHTGNTPHYKTLKQEGPDHAKKFTVGVYVGEELVAEGEGHSKQEAEQVAARNALDKKGWE